MKKGLLIATAIFLFIAPFYFFSLSLATAAGVAKFMSQRGWQSTKYTFLLLFIFCFSDPLSLSHLLYFFL